MKLVKYILFLLFLPAAVRSQTAHIKDDRVIYEGEVTVANTSQAELFERARTAIQNVKAGKERIIEENEQKARLAAKGSIRLAAPHHLIRHFDYVLELFVENGKYKYRIDSVVLRQKERGGGTIRIPSQKLVEIVEETGLQAIEAEKELNEIDMNLQKVLALVNREMKKATVTGAGN